MKVSLHPEWPVLTSYQGDYLRRVALPLGGIGTGTVSLGGRGDLRDWEIVNRPAKGFSPLHSFFGMYAKAAGEKPVARLLEGPIHEADYEGATGSRIPNHGLPRFRDSSFHTCYPFGQVLLSDPEVPIAVRIEAFNPLIPADPDASGIPVAVFRFVLLNRSRRPVEASICGALQNFIGTDGSHGAPKKNINTFRRAAWGTACQGLFFGSRGVDHRAEQYGSMALVVLSRGAVTYRTAWQQERWSDTLLDFWEDFCRDGKLTPRGRPQGNVDAPVGSLAASVKVPARSSRALTFLLAWYFPNRQTWTPAKPASSDGRNGKKAAPAADRIGNFYTTQYRDAWDVIRRTAAILPRLESKTILFVRSVCESDLPAVVKEAALYNLSTLRSQTCFRTADGRFYGWEGCHDRSGCCHGSCTHVWNYEQATAFLFGSLSRAMREVEFLHATNDDGLMSFRVNLPISRARNHSRAAADGQMGCLLKLYRDWQLSGDDALLRTLWPQARKALEFCWKPGGWDADQDGVMEGCQHNTMDVEYYGPNPQMGAWYLGALRAAEEMARYLGEDRFADTCHQTFTSGSRWMDRHLFNGKYYEHQIRPPRIPASIRPGLVSWNKSRRRKEPDFQVGPGCVVDQLVGQYMSHVCGLGYLLRPDHVGRTLRSIVKYNFKKQLWGHYNHLRSFVLDGESGVLMGTYPKGFRPLRPFPYFREVMTGFEYALAVHLMYEGMEDEGLRVVRAIRARYDGKKRSPFDEAECGHHYARAMASWAAVLALTGFQYSAVRQTMSFKARTGRHFWSTGDAWGTCVLKVLKNRSAVRLTVLGGRLALKTFILTGAGFKEFEATKTLRAASSLAFHIPL